MTETLPIPETRKESLEYHSHTSNQSPSEVVTTTFPLTSTGQEHPDQAGHQGRQPLPELPLGYNGEHAGEVMAETSYGRDFQLLSSTSRFSGCTPWNRVLQTVAELIHTRPAVPRPSRSDVTGLCKHNCMPESCQVCSGVGACREEEIPNPQLVPNPPLTNCPPAQSPRACPAQKPKAMDSKPLPDSVFWNRNPGLTLGWEGPSKVESSCSFI